MSCKFFFNALFIFGFMLMPEKIPAQPPDRPDNFTLLQMLCERVADQMLKRLKAEAGDAIFLPPVKDASSCEALLRGQIVNHALDAGHRVFTKDSSLAVQNYFQLNSQLLKCEVEYIIARSGGLWRRSTVRRQTAVEAEIEVTEHPSGQILMHESFKAVFADTVRASETHRLENPSLPFTVGSGPRQQSVWARILEPLALAAAAGVAVYALYSLRSQ
jgi:hypothetical protein